MVKADSTSSMCASAIAVWWILSSLITQGIIKISENISEIPIEGVSLNNMWIKLSKVLKDKADETNAVGSSTH